MKSSPIYIGEKRRQSVTEVLHKDDKASEKCFGEAENRCEARLLLRIALAEVLLPYHTYGHPARFAQGPPQNHGTPENLKNISMEMFLMRHDVAHRGTHILLTRIADAEDAPTLLDRRSRGSKLLHLNETYRSFKLINPRENRSPKRKKRKKPVQKAKTIHVCKWQRIYGELGESPTIIIIVFTVQDVWKYDEIQKIKRPPRPHHHSRCNGTIYCCKALRRRSPFHSVAVESVSASVSFVVAWSLDAVSGSRSNCSSHK